MDINYCNTNEDPLLTSEDKVQIADILKRRANEVANYHMDYIKDEKHLGSVELALSREIERLRALSQRLTSSIVWGEDNDK